MADATRHSIPSYPWGRALTIPDLNTERGFVFQYPPFPVLTSLAEGAKPPQEPVGLYFHIPFCGYRCSYCYYAISLKDNDEETSRYVTNVFKEVEQSGPD